ncbi:MAG: hypothetical protein WA985_02430 [Erythrobacter sp.]
MRTFFALDRRLGRIVAGTSEPMLGQMRLAWWRDSLRQDPDARPRGDAVLDAIGTHWRGHEAALVGLVDGWEYMLAETLDRSAAQAFAQGRAEPFAALVRMASGEKYEDEALKAGRCWALADAAAHLGEGEERTMLLDLARENAGATLAPGGLRGLAVLEALARRSVRRGGRPLMEGRGASLVAARAAIIGR